jgi:hypothetical protein
MYNKTHASDAFSCRESTARYGGNIYNISTLALLGGGIINMLRKYE